MPHDEHASPSSGDRINVTSPEALRETDAAVAEAEREKRDADRHRLAILAMLDQALATEELEELCYLRQWALERSAIDTLTAARAIVNHCTRLIDGRRSFLAKHPECDGNDRAEAERTICIASQIRARWERRITAYTKGR